MRLKCTWCYRNVLKIFFIWTPRTLYILWSICLCSRLLSTCAEDLFLHSNSKAFYNDTCLVQLASVINQLESQSITVQTLNPVAGSTATRKCTTTYAVLCRLCLKTYSKCYCPMNSNTNSNLIWEAVGALCWHYWYVAPVKVKKIYYFSIQRSKGNIICYFSEQ